MSGGATTTYPHKYVSKITKKTGSTTYATTTEFIFGGESMLTNVVSDQNMNAVQVLDYFPYGELRVSSSTSRADAKRKGISRSTTRRTAQRIPWAMAPRQGIARTQSCFSFLKPRRRLHQHSRAGLKGDGRPTPIREWAVFAPAISDSESGTD